ncbi:unnamed protein product, partial [Meganyctiphanes norvegica]
MHTKELPYEVRNQRYRAIYQKMRRSRNCALVRSKLIFLISCIPNTSTGASLFHSNDPSGIFPAFTNYPVDHHSTSTSARINETEEEDMMQPTPYDVVVQLLDTQERLVRTADTVALAMQNLTGSVENLSISLQNSMAIIAESMQKMSGTISNLSTEMVDMKRTSGERFNEHEFLRSQRIIENVTK